MSHLLYYSPISSANIKEKNILLSLTNKFVQLININDNHSVRENKTMKELI